MDRELLDQSNAVASAIFRLIRRFYALADDDPSTELPVAQLRVCGILRDGPRVMSALRKELGISCSAITQIADRLERSGLVERVCEEDDRRVKVLQLTKYGEEVMRRRREKRVECIYQALTHLSPEAREQVLAGLKTLLDAPQPGDLPDA